MLVYLLFYTVSSQENNEQRDVNPSSNTFLNECRLNRFQGITKSFGM